MCKNERVFDESIELKNNAMLRVRPELFNEWDFEKNDELGLNIYKITFGSGKKVSWLGKCGHPAWFAAVCNRIGRGDGCPYCSSQKVLKGFNDMWTTNPELAKMLADPEDGYKYTQSSNVKVDWECLRCENVIKDKSILNINNCSLSCPVCSDGIKFPEKFMYHLLKEAGIEFEFDIAQAWSGKLRYDFYLPEHNWIIEVHGIQHYKKSFKYSSDKTRSLLEEQKNDSHKENLAKENSIDNYIVIDARLSTVEHMKNSVLNSDMINIIGNVKFEDVGEKLSSTIIKDACALWESGNHNVLEIAKLLKIGKTTALRYLKRGAEIGWSDFTVKKSQRIGTNKLKKIIIQLSRDQKFVKEWDSTVEAAEILKISKASISQVCTNRRKTAGGFKWMHKDNYYRLITSQSDTQEVINKDV